MSKFTYVALGCAAMSLLASSPSNAQEANLTAGGDVSAEQVTPLPPVVVEAPSQPIVRKKVRKATAAGSGATAAAGTPAQGEATGAGTAGTGVGIYTLGQLDMIGGSTITNEAMWTFNKNTLDQAVSILPGVSMQNSGGHRNERDIQVRGFDRFRVPLYMDGVRIYLPYDNRLDMNRFLTPDLSEIQVQKGYVSVLNGPGGMGGAINLVSRKPTKEIELEGRAGLVMSGDLDDMNQWSSYAFAGTRQKGYYAQVSGTIIDQDHFNLSNDFRPSNASEPGYVASFPYEDGGSRDRSNFKDWRVNAKIGITPNATDEYSVNYTVQQGEKGAPLHVRRQVVGGYQGAIPSTTVPGTTINGQRYWNWPQWDTSTLSWMSKTQLGSSSYVKTNAYYNTFDNTTAFYPTATHPTPYVDSPYDDNSYGGFVEMGTDLIPMNTLKGAIHYRRDTHNEAEIQYNLDGSIKSIAPNERDAEETWSFAAENTFHATRYFDIVTGLSYDTNEVLEAYGSKEALPKKDAWNWQAAAIYNYSDTGRVYGNVSSRTRFPTLFDRYSTRFGSRSENPGLDPERATNYELGWSESFFGNLHLSSAVFYSDIDDSIQNIFFNANGNTSIVGFNADGETYGLELSADWDATSTLRIGGNYTYLERDFDFASAARALNPILTSNGSVNTSETNFARHAVASGEAEGTPRHKAFLYASWRATSALTLTPSLELAGDRTVLVTSCASTLVNAGATNNNTTCTKTSPAGTRTPSYVNLGSYALVNFRADYDFSESFSTAVGVTNLFDQNYSLAEGFPEAGRQFYITARAKF